MSSFLINRRNNVICFIILHYVVKNETEACVESIQKLIGEKRIIIVDNASPNNSGKELKKTYSEIDNIDVLLLAENGGFAKGNNAGYSYAKKNYNPKYIIIMNNDIQINQVDFVSKIEDLYNKEKYAVLGPDVYATSLNIHQSPKRLSHYTLNEVENLLTKYKRKNEDKIIKKMRIYMKRIKLLKRFVYLKRIHNNSVDHKKSYTNVPLHGSCLIFSELFISQREKAFFDKTFMYYETEILDYECYNNGLKTIYSPKIQVLHNHNVSTNETFKSDFKRTEFMNECIIESLTAFLALMENK